MPARKFLRGLGERLLLGLPTKHRGDRLILSYHNVVEEDAINGDRSLHLSARDFAEHLTIASRLGKLVSLPELLSAVSTKAPLIAVTFDDAYAGALRHGVTMCAAQDIPCSVFVAPGLLGSITVWDQRAAQGQWTPPDRERFLQHERGMGQPVVPHDKGDPRRIATESELTTATTFPQVLLGNHTYSHANLAALQTEECVQEIDRAQRWLRARYPEKTMAMVAYPYGRAPKEATTVLQATQLSHGLLVQGGWMHASNAASALVPRWNVPAGISSRGFELRLRGRLI